MPVPVGQPQTRPAEHTFRGSSNHVEQVRNNHYLLKAKIIAKSLAGEMMRIYIL